MRQCRSHPALSPVTSHGQRTELLTVGGTSRSPRWFTASETLTELAVELGMGSVYEDIQVVVEQEAQRDDVVAAVVHESERGPLHAHGREGAGVAEQIEAELTGFRIGLVEERAGQVGGCRPDSLGEGEDGLWRETTYAWRGGGSSVWRYLCPSLVMMVGTGLSSRFRRSRSRGPE